MKNNIKMENKINKLKYNLLNNIIGVDYLTNEEVRILL